MHRPLSSAFLCALALGSAASLACAPLDSEDLGNASTSSGGVLSTGASSGETASPGSTTGGVLGGPGAGGSPVVPTPDPPGNPEPPPPPPPPPGSVPVTLGEVHLKTTVEPYFLGADQNGGGPIWANATVAQTWETFSLIDENGGTLESGDGVRLVTGKGNHFSAQAGALSATAGSTDPSGALQLVRAEGSGTVESGDIVGFKTTSGAWLSAVNGGGTTVNAAGAAFSTWESFALSWGTLVPPTDPPTDPPTEPPPSVPNAPRAPGLRTLENGRGATLPFAEYEAETMTTNGAQLGPSRTFGEVASEASGRRLVRLSATGQYVEWTNAYASNAIVVRYSVPDLGADSWTTLSVFVNGEFRAKLSTTSRYSWTYGGDGDFNKSWQNDPGIGNPHHFFDETRALLGDIPVGAKVQLRKADGDTASYYDIDLVDLEQVGPALGKPSGYLSLSADCGGTGNDNSDDSAALQYCVDRARNEGRGVYIPEGTFRSYSKGISLAGVSVRGAGPWRSTVAGYFARFDCFGNNCSYADFSLFGDTTRRIDDSPETAFSGNGSSGTTLDNVWVEHVKVGYWTGPGTNGLLIKNSRFRNLFADGVNFYGGTANSVVENSHFRNTGDDALAGWAHNTNGQSANTNNSFRKNYVQVPWRANCFALYGGGNNIIEDNVCADVVQYPGILLGRQFDSHAFFGSTQVRRNTLLRVGGWAYGQEQGALKLHAQQGPVEYITITDLEVLSPTYYAIHVQGQSSIGSVWFDRVVVSNPASGVFFLNWGSKGAMNADNITASGSPQGVRNDSQGRST